MRTVTYKLADLKKIVINLGKVAENDATQVRIDAAEVFGNYPEAQVALSVTNPEGETYPATVQRDGDFVVWDVKDSSLTTEGDGEIQISFSQSGAKIRSDIGRTKICRSIIGEGEAPDPVQDWVDHAEEVLAELENAIPGGGTTGQVLGKKSDEDYDLEWIDQGAGGVSDYDDLTNRPKIGGVTLTGDKSLNDLGIAAESAIPDPTSIIDDTAGDGDTNKVWSADKTAEETSALLSALSVLEPSASASDVGKMLKVKTVADGKVTAYEFGEGGGSVDPSIIAEAVDDWLDEHPEAVTTVQDGAVTEPKLADSLKQRIMTYVPLNGWDTVNWQTGYINGNGTVTSNGNFRNTDFIPVSEGDVISYNLRGYSTEVYLVTGYDSSKARVASASVVGNSSFAEGTYTVPSGVAFVKISSGSVSDTSLYFKSDDVIGTNPQSTKTYIDNADNALSARVTANETELASLDGIESVKEYYKKSVNLCDISKVSDASSTIGAGYVITDYMPVTAGQRYTIWADGKVYELSWFNNAKTQLSSVVINNNGQEKTAPENAAYARVSFKSANVSKLMFAAGVVGDYVPFDILIPKTQLPDYIERDTNNLYDPSLYIIATSIANDGSITAYSNSVSTDFIAVDEGHTYYVNAVTDGGALNITGKAAYNSSFEYVETISSFPYTVPEGISYIRIGYSTNTGYGVPCVRKDNTGISGFDKFNDYDTFKLVRTKPTAFEQRNSLYGLKWNAMGDSVTEGSGTTKTYCDFIAERTGILPTNYGVSNTAIARRGQNYTDDMSVRYVNMTNDADIVTVFGGTNDHGNNIPIGEWGDSTVDTVYGAMKILCEGLIGKYMGKRIGFILPLPKYVSNTDYSYPSASFKPYIDCIKDVCARYSIPILDLWTESGIAPALSGVRTAMISDGLHPNATGHELISWKIQRFLESL